MAYKMAVYYPTPFAFVQGMVKIVQKCITDYTIFINPAPKTLVRMVGRVDLFSHPLCFCTGYGKNSTKMRNR